VLVDARAAIVEVEQEVPSGRRPARPIDEKFRRAEVKVALVVSRTTVRALSSRSSDRCLTFACSTAWWPNHHVPPHPPTVPGHTANNQHHRPCPSPQPDPCPVLEAIPSSSVYRQGTEALTQRKLDILKAANGDAEKVEKELNEGMIEEVIKVAEDELSLVAKMIEWKAYVLSSPFPHQPQADNSS
jgi:hypothetical protein